MVVTGGRDVELCFAKFIDLPLAEDINICLGIDTTVVVLIGVVAGVVVKLETGHVVFVTSRRLRAKIYFTIDVSVAI